MTMNFTRAVLAAFTLCAAVLTAPAFAADEAILVGVDKYPGLRPGSDLGGCVNDAKLIQSKLEKYGFKCTLIGNEQATKDGILAALAAVKTRLKPGDEFVFYFAGHGTIASGGDSVVLTYSSKDNSESGDIGCSQLYTAVKSLPVAAKTILLDSCHSGGMVRSVNRLKGDGKTKPRVYIRSLALTRGQGKDWQKVRVNGPDDMTDTTKGGGVCYFTAALKTQVANETEIEGVRHGLFTYNLASKLNGERDLWSDVSAAVSAGVMEASDGEQKPVLAPVGFLQTKVFDGGKGGPAPNPGPNPGPKPGPAPQPKPAPDTTLEKLYNLSCPDPSKVALKMMPEISPVQVGEQVRFTITVGQEGYLVLVGRDPEGKLALLFPESGAEPVKVKAGDKISIPGAGDEAFTPSTAGTDGLKAILFTAPENAQAMISALSGGEIDQNKTKEWKKIKTKASPFYTSELITQIVGK
jgi:hypothetical protein